MTETAHSADSDAPLSLAEVYGSRKPEEVIRAYEQAIERLVETHVDAYWKFHEYVEEALKAGDLVEPDEEFGDNMTWQDREFAAQAAGRIQRRFPVSAERTALERLVDECEQVRTHLETTLEDDLPAWMFNIWYDALAEAKTALIDGSTDV